MAENVIISEGGVGRKFLPVHKLKINNQNSGQSLWVAEDEVSVGSINVTSNGVYPAVEDDFYAYDEVTVDVAEDITDPSDSNSLVGKDTDGNDYEYGLDDNGNLNISMLPSAIHIVVKPRKLKYEDGELIDFTGIHVYLMDGNNGRYTDGQYPTGEIPFGELMFPVTTADKSQIKEKSYTSDILPDEMKPFTPVTQAVYKNSSKPEITCNTVTVLGKNGTLYHTPGKGNVSTLLAASDLVTTCVLIDEYDSETGAYTRTFEQKPNGGQIYTHDGKTVYYQVIHSGFSGVVLDGEPLPEYTLDDETQARIAWTLLYGSEIAGGVTIPVQWMRSDGEILEDAFIIDVGAGGEPGPPEPDPWDGLYDFEWGGHKYNLNKSLKPDEVHYSNGTVWQEWLGGQSPPYTVPQAVTMGLVMQVG